MREAHNAGWSWEGPLKGEILTTSTDKCLKELNGDKIFLEPDEQKFLQTEEAESNKYHWIYDTETFSVDEESLTKYKRKTRLCD